MAITRRQKQVLDFIAGFIEEHRYSPSYEEIARAGGGILSTVLATRAASEDALAETAAVFPRNIAGNPAVLKAMIEV